MYLNLVPSLNSPAILISNWSRRLYFLIHLAWSRKTYFLLIKIKKRSQIWCDFDRASSLICGNKIPTRCNRGFHYRSYCLLNMFRAPLCPSSGAQKYYTMLYYITYLMEQKLAAYRYHIERMLRLSLNRTHQLGEWKNIPHTATSNNFPTTLLQKLKQQIQHKITTPPPTKNTENNTKWATFTFSSSHIRNITNLFRHTKVKVS